MAIEPKAQQLEPHPPCSTEGLAVAKGFGLGVCRQPIGEMHPSRIDAQGLAQGLNHFCSEGSRILRAKPHVFIQVEAAPPLSQGFLRLAGLAAHQAHQ
jgi:hypothetical protein